MKFTAQPVAEIERFAMKGKSSSWIACRLDLNEGSVSYRMLRLGFDPWPGQSRLPRGCQRGAFSESEERQMLELAKTMTVKAVARALNRPYTSVRIRLMTLEVRAEKDAA